SPSEALSLSLAMLRQSSPLTLKLTDLSRLVSLELA
ncbi:hypothetical protein A2U01_0035293, partial [Trifolium medium]|nr:hypothetical protein [Trifolium medium]